MMSETEKILLAILYILAGVLILGLILGIISKIPLSNNVIEKEDDRFLESDESNI